MCAGRRRLSLGCSRVSRLLQIVERAVFSLENWVHAWISRELRILFYFVYCLRAFRRDNATKGMSNNSKEFSMQGNCKIVFFWKVLNNASTESSRAAKSEVMFRALINHYSQSTMESRKILQICILHLKKFFFSSSLSH